MTALLFVPGLSCDAALFAAQTEALSATHPIAIANVAGDDTIEAMAERVLAAAPPHFALAGLSMGGYVALAIARVAPERVRALALLDTNARPDAPASSENRRAAIAAAEGGRYDEVLERLLPVFVHPDRLGDAELCARITAMGRRIGPQAFVRQQKAIIARPDARPALARLRVPSLVMGGEADVLSTPELMREMAEAIPNAQLELVPRCGHLVTMERPDVATAALRQLLEQVA